MAGQTKKGLKVVPIGKKKRGYKSRNFIASAHEIAEKIDMNGFAIVGWDKNGTHMCHYTCGKVPAEYMPEYVRNVLFAWMMDL